MNSKAQKQIIPKRNEMLSIIQQYVPRINRKEMISFYESYDRILAKAIYSQHTLPNAQSSGLDGIAVRFSDFALGMPDTKYWTVGKEYDYCNTGMSIPPIYDMIP